MNPFATHVIFGVMLFLILASISVADFRKLIIPDSLNLALAGAGLAFQASRGMENIKPAILFALATLLLFLAIRIGFRLIRGRDGLGLGDVKMAGACAFWFSPWSFPFYLLVTCLSALGYAGFIANRSGALSLSTRIAFGPFLGIGLFVTWLAEITETQIFVPYGF